MFTINWITQHPLIIVIYVFSYFWPFLVQGWRRPSGKKALPLMYSGKQTMLLYTNNCFIEVLKYFKLSVDAFCIVITTKEKTFNKQYLLPATGIGSKFLAQISLKVKFQSIIVAHCVKLDALGLWFLRILIIQHVFSVTDEFFHVSFYNSVNLRFWRRQPVV